MAIDLDDEPQGESQDDDGNTRPEEEVEELARKAPEEGKRERKERGERPDKKPGRSKDEQVEMFLAKLLRGVQPGGQPKSITAALNAAGKDHPELEWFIIEVPGYFQRCEQAATDKPDDETVQRRAAQAARWRTIFTDDFAEELPDQLEEEEEGLTSAKDRQAAEKRAEKQAAERSKTQQSILGWVLLILFGLLALIWYGWIFHIARSGGSGDPSRPYTQEPLYRDQNPVVPRQSDPMRYRQVTPENASRKSSSDVPFDPALGK
ncbi:MAG: hypothetical protein U0136_12065 [Bdellovibrionota bacterium]